MNYGFVIDNRACIGCHACSTACKSENEVPVGVYRTWVKYTETGTYPNTQRTFQVSRCNHCANPPCVRICPTQAMYQRDDGIVEFDNKSCIGCKACLQACPYDAIHIDPSTGTAAKCHYCAHRIEVGLEPSCVVVCPTHAIIAGDIDDETSEIHRILSKSRTSVRKPEQGTAPKLFYIEGHDASMVPTSAPADQNTFMWADKLDDHDKPIDLSNGRPRLKVLNNESSSRTNRNGVPLRPPQSQGLPQGGPIVTTGATRAEHMVQVGYNAQHKVPWHWPVPAYLVTKAIAGGLFSLVALAWLMGWASFDSTAAIATAGISTFFMLVTTGLLVFDLEQPQRFLYILLRPQWKSWLVRGAFFLIAFSTVAGLWMLAELAGNAGALSAELLGSVRKVVVGAGLPLALGVIVYTAFLFGQAEGRDLWQSSLLPVHLVVQAAIAGAATLMLLGSTIDLPTGLDTVAVYALGAGLAVDLGIIILGEMGMAHPTDVAAQGAHEMMAGRYRNHFWYGAIVSGHVIPLALLLLAPQSLLPLAALLTLVGLYAYEHAFVMAPQRVPNT